MTSGVATDDLEDAARLLLAPGSEQAHVGPVHGRDPGVVVARPAPSTLDPEVGRRVEVAAGVVREGEVIVDVAVGRAAWFALGARRSVGLDPVGRFCGEAPGLGEDPDRVIQAPHGDEPVPQVPAQAVAVGVLHERREVPADGLVVAPEVPEAPPDPDRPLLRGRLFQGEPRRLEVELEPSHGRGREGGTLQGHAEQRGRLDGDRRGRGAHGTGGAAEREEQAQGASEPGAEGPGGLGGAERSGGHRPFVATFSRETGLRSGKSDA